MACSLSNGTSENQRLERRFENARGYVFVFSNLFSAYKMQCFSIRRMRRSQLSARQSAFSKRDCNGNFQRRLGRVLRGDNNYLSKKLIQTSSDEAQSVFPAPTQHPFRAVKLEIGKPKVVCYQ